jgi:hypothetical protein
LRWAVAELFLLSAFPLEGVSAAIAGDDLASMMRTPQMTTAARITNRLSSREPSDKYVTTELSKPITSGGE